MTPQTREDIAREVEAFCPELHAQALVNATVRTYLDDWCRLGSFLTQEILVQAELKKLNTKVQKRLRQLVKALPPGQVTADANGVIQVPRDLDILKALEDELDEVEAQHNFNRGQQGWQQNVDLQHLDLQTQAFREVPSGTDVNLPKGAPTLSGFVDPSAFRQILFAHGYHWIDPGAGSAHGAYTHRIQWYCIVQAQVRVAHDKSYLSLFRAMSHKLCLTASGKQALWDLLFDAFKSSSRDTPHSDTYRSPELLHDFLTNHARLSDPDYKCLARILKFAKTRDSFDWVGKAAGLEMANVKQGIGPSVGGRVIPQAVGAILWTNDRVRVVDVDKEQ
jgi:hypothetical protein